MALRERNLSSERPSETTLKSLDSSLKKVAAFLQKIKERLGEETRKQLLEEPSTVSANGAQLTVSTASCAVAL